MSLPIKLFPGIISIYGGGSIYGLFQLKDPINTIQFGIIDQTYPNPSKVARGDSVMFQPKDSIPIFYSIENTQYYLVPEDKIISVENVPGPPL